MIYALLISLLIPAFTLLFIRFFLSVTTVWGYSMFPTLVHGDRLLVLRHRSSKRLKMDQIVVGDYVRVPPPSEQAPPRARFAPASGPANSQAPSVASKFVKRLVGLPGDTIVVHISELHELMRSSLQPECDNQGNLVWHIPPGHCFVRGDAPVSGDSVSWGPIPLRAISGVVLTKLPRRADLSQAEPPIPGYPSFSPAESSPTEKEK